VLVGITALHVAAVAVALLVKGPVADSSDETAAIEVVLFRESELEKPPEVSVQLPQFTPPQLVIPVVNIEVPETAAPTITVVAVPEAAPTPSPSPIAVAGDLNTPVAISNAEWVRKPRPVYPAAAKKARAQGVVEVRALVDINGHALKASVHRSSGFAALDKAACESVLASLFRPYLHNGVPRSVDVIVPVTFALAGKGGESAPVRARHREPALQIDVRGEDHYAMSGHAEELRSLGAAALHVSK
jgi:TonB family protein